MAARAAWGGSRRLRWRGATRETAGPAGLFACRPPSAARRRPLRAPWFARAPSKDRRPRAGTAPAGRRESVRNVHGRARPGPCRALCWRGPRRRGCRQRLERARGRRGPPYRDISAGGGLRAVAACRFPACCRGCSPTAGRPAPCIPRPPQAEGGSRKPGRQPGPPPIPGSRPQRPPCAPGAAPPAFPSPCGNLAAFRALDAIGAKGRTGRAMDVPRPPNFDPMPIAGMTAAIKEAAEGGGGDARPPCGYEAGRAAATPAGPCPIGSRDGPPPVATDPFGGGQGGACHARARHAARAAGRLGASGEKAGMGMTGGTMAGAGHDG